VEKATNPYWTVAMASAPCGQIWLGNRWECSKSISTSKHARPALAGHWQWPLWKEGPQLGPIFPQATLYPPILYIIHPSANFLFQSHPPNTENASSLILLQCIRKCFRKPRHIGPLLEFPWTFLGGPLLPYIG
jgi:hypothetical protein